MEIVIIRGADSSVRHWRDELAAVYAPRRLVFPIPDDATDLPLAVPDKRATGANVAYICRGMTCSSPINSLPGASLATRKSGLNTHTAGQARWWILVFTSVALFGNYHVYDSIAPVADLLQRQLGFSSTQLGTLNAIYSAPNIVLVLVGGVLTDRFGAARVTFWTAVICVLGAMLTAIGSRTSS